ncbi:MAG: zinc ribbon domain-containing protein [Chloroflexi bacterium]|mgnify:CR=1 FL=1|nr:zinc ribbon domain-containing protein [Chloroflexota bacterium]
MPFYEYRCQQCGHLFEQYVRSLFSSATEACPKCGSTESKRVVSRLGAYSRSGSAASAGGCAPSGG